MGSLGVPAELYNRLPIGGYVKVPHEGCSNSEALKITNDVEGYSFHCFKCGDHGFLRHADQSYLDRKRRINAAKALTKAQAEQSYDLPADFSQTIAGAGLAWLGQGGWTLDLIEQYKIGWSESLQRVIIPVYDNNCYQGFTARAVLEGQQPKYWERLRYKTWRSVERTPDTICLNEDVLSAGRVGQFVSSAALLGTAINNDTLLPAVVGRSHIVLWFDGDTAGDTARVKAKGVLQWLPGVSISDIRTEIDPKLLTNEEIHECLKSTGCFSRF